jgi:GT2 family glycosyltransferase
MVSVIETVPRATVVGSKLLYPDTKLIQHAGIVFGELKEPYHIYQHLASDHPAVNRMEDYQAVTGACMLLEKTIFIDAGMFDESYINGYEDIDLCLRIKHAGCRIIYAPSSVLLHAEFTTDGRKNNQSHNLNLFLTKRKNSISSDENIYYKKNGHAIVYDPDDPRKFTVYTPSPTNI